MAKTNLIQSNFIQYNLLLHELHAGVYWKPGTYHTQYATYF